MLPFLELVDSHFLLEAEHAIEKGKRAGFALVSLFEQLELPDRRVARIVRAYVEMAGVGAHAAVQAAVEIGRGLRIEVLHEVVHRLLDALLRAHVALFVVTDLGRLVGQPLRLTIERVSAVYGGHVLAPLRSNTMPVVPRVMNTRNVCPSLPNGSQIMSAATLRICTASKVS